MTMTNKNQISPSAIELLRLGLWIRKMATGLVRRLSTELPQPQSNSYTTFIYVQALPNIHTLQWFRGVGVTWALVSHPWILWHAD